MLVKKADGSVEERQCGGRVAFSLQGQSCRVLVSRQYQADHAAITSLIRIIRDSENTNIPGSRPDLG
jgi:hypothetical protein